MTEDSLLSRLPRTRGRDLILGIGDDCAIFRPKPGEDLLFTTDLFLEDIHFKRSQKPTDLGRRALARSLSDIAAMGGEPRFCLVSLALPDWANRKWTGAFYRGLLKLADETGTSLAGGDLSHSEKLVCDVMVCGSVPAGKAIRRDGARSGDIVYVSGPLGGWRHRPVITPRVDIGRKLRGRATSAIDLSDGLSLDLHRLCAASGVSAALDRVPLLRGAIERQALHEGEDYELLYTAPPRVRVPGERIGVITKGRPGTVEYRGKPLSVLGYDHFSHRR